jgi:hypothetical protein
MPLLYSAPMILVTVRRKAAATKLSSLGNT